MRTILLLLLLALVAGAAFAAPEDVTIRGDGGFALRATFYPAAKPGPSVLLLHQCNRDRTAYAKLAASLAAAGVHTLTFDFRGFGESKDENARDFQEQSEALWPHFAKDVDAALEYLVSRPGVDKTRIGVLGASCGGSQALLAAGRRPEIRRLVFLSSSLPWLDDADIKAFEQGRPIPLLCIASEEDRGTYERTKRIFQSSMNQDTRMILYKGSAHGAPLFDQDPTLIGVIADWFAGGLR
jgi:dienelactone hydrolase